MARQATVTPIGGPGPHYRVVVCHACVHVFHGDNERAVEAASLALQQKWVKEGRHDIYRVRPGTTEV